MKNNVMKVLLGLGLVAVLTACGSSDKATEAPEVVPGVDTQGVCSGKQTKIFTDRAEIMGECADPDGIDVDSLQVHILGNDLPLTSIKEENIVREGDKVVAIKDWQMIFNLPTNEGTPFGTTATISMNSIDGETLEYELVESEKFDVQTKVAETDPDPEPEPEPEPNQPPTWTQDVYDTGLTIDDSTDDVQIIMDLTGECVDLENDTVTLSVDSVSAGGPFDETKFEDSLFFDNSVLKIKNLMTNDPAVGGIVTVKVKCSAIGGSDITDVLYEYKDFQ